MTHEPGAVGTAATPIRVRPRFDAWIAWRAEKMNFSSFVLSSCCRLMSEDYSGLFQFYFS
jgi:hypothetical protein